MAEATNEHEIDSRSYRNGLKKIRRRRWFLWAVILAYLPAMMLAFEATNANRAAVSVFISWLSLLCIAVGFACVVRCPRCGKPFHTHGPTFLPLRHCVHCCLHINADRIDSVRHNKSCNQTKKKPRQKV